ncbi:ComF family protein [Bifidobacterium sp. LC6]|uniref:ComF family protein n=1 Tax=Bifidobacterium colobi TaxID=2809026 RepID=A0ABS5UW66_9BIFI|nr:ComF family protein [Bifidobacterium colobi]MBT1174844.1 ComF family protein [Bifidobacterium colobi]
MDAVRDVLFPRGCAGCDMPDAVLCPECMSRFSYCRIRDLTAGRGVRGAEPLPAWASAIYQGAVRHAILAWKDHDDVELDAAFASIMTALTMRTPIGEMCNNTAASVLVVPLPSSRGSMRKRGRWHTLPLAQAVADTLCQQGIDATMAPMLRNMASAGRSVQQISAAQRASRIGGNIRLAPQYAESRDYDNHPAVILVDDIITTGSTMRQCAQVCRRAGYRVVGALALADVIVDEDSAF